MEIEEAISILRTTIKELGQIRPRGTGIRAENIKGLIVENCRFIGLEKALDVSDSEDITWKRNIVNSYENSSALVNLLEQFLNEATKQKSQVNKPFLARIKEQVLRRWPELAGTVLFIAMIRTIEHFM
jgi:hypothetical protein